MIDQSSEYYRARASREAELADQVVNAEVAELHRRLASRYAQLADEAEAAGR